ncbi:MAG: Amidohydrolase [Chthoniobacteraceae bacterium]|nr:Amidohydrolase [Chthoniobacteraceae bacterium]
MILKAKAVVTMEGEPIADGVVVIQGNRIVATGMLADLEHSDTGPLIDLGDFVLMPGLINAHCHLDYTMMRHAISPPASFTAWVRRINALKRSLDSEDYLDAIARGFAELQRWGTTTVCNIESFPELMALMPSAPIRTWWFYEMIDIRHRITTDDVIAGALTFFQQHLDNHLGGFGLSPHAPYTASTALYQLADECASIQPMPLTTHVAESREEFAMFQHASGPMYDFIRALDRPMDDCGDVTPFQLLWRKGAIDARWILAHMNELSEEDFALLESLPKEGGPHIVHCPGSHQYFQHSRFPFRRLHEIGLNLCIGTDSLASTDSLSLFCELRKVRENEPWLSARELLCTVTVNPARALNRSLDLGRIIPGALADLIAFPISGAFANVLEAVIAYANPVPWMMINGQIIS